MNAETRFRKSALRNAVVLALSINGAAITLSGGTTYAAQSACADAVSSTSANFTMLSAAGATVGGTNDVTMSWDGTAFTSSSDYAGPGSSVSNVTASSPTAFFGHNWTAHDIQLFAPGSYSFNTATGGGNPESGTMNVTVNSGQLGMHMLFDWNGNNNIDVFVVANLTAAFGASIGRSTQSTNCDQTASATSPKTNCLWDGAKLGPDGKPAGSKVWMLSSADGNADGIMGVPMATAGPFAGFNANFNLPGTFSHATGVCAGFVDTTPDAFTFTAKTNATLSTQYESNTITVAGLGVSQSTPNPAQTAAISITGTGAGYSINGGAFTSVTGTVSNGDIIKVHGTAPAANGQTTNVVLTIGTVAGTYSISTPPAAGAQGSNFTMLDSSGGVTGGTNDVVASWDSSCTTNIASTDFTHMSLSSTTPFFSYNWTAHHIRVFCPGTYTIDTTCTVAQLEAGTTTCNNPLQTNPPQTQQFYTFTVGAGQIGAHMLFNWNNATNIDVVEVWNQNAVFGPSGMYTGSAACNNPATVWNLMSTDWDNDGRNGGAMVDGAFVGFSANFNIRTSGTPLTCDAYTPTVNVSSPSGAGGCSISARPSNGIERGDWWIIAGFLAWLGGIQMRLKRKVKS